ncbi:MAG TPA: class II aldolase/adducin family protein [Xanthobacteraceae bacterium]|jgi:ribulose-5-phosphate 4-epimerase/fuculose-1-phosphate aldolase|nr:class II aldolase/adducin family protein [Xanthobacteraceae bacterium]
MSKGSHAAPGRRPAAGDQRRLAAEVAAATRILVSEGILDYSGHLSVRVPGRDAFLIQRGEDSRAELAPDTLLLVDHEGRVIEGDGKPPSELPIHIEILKARPDVQAVLHCHLEVAIAFTMMQGVTLVPMRARAVRWESGIPTDPDPSHIKLPEQGRALAKTLGPHNAALMRAHGMVLVAESAPAVLVDAVHFKENANALLQVLQAGRTPLPLTAAEMERINRHEMREFHVGKLWNYYVRKAISAGVVPREWDILG